MRLLLVLSERYSGMQQKDWKRSYRLVLASHLGVDLDITIGMLNLRRKAMMTVDGKKMGVGRRARKKKKTDGRPEDGE
jgi:hypothetical protein